MKTKSCMISPRRVRYTQQRKRWRIFSLCLFSFFRLFCLLTMQNWCLLLLRHLRISFYLEVSWCLALLHWPILPNRSDEAWEIQSRYQAVIKLCSQELQRWCLVVMTTQWTNCLILKQWTRSQTLILGESIRRMSMRCWKGLVRHLLLAGEQTYACRPYR